MSSEIPFRMCQSLVTVSTQDHRGVPHPQEICPGRTSLTD